MREADPSAGHGEDGTDTDRVRRRWYVLAALAAALPWAGLAGRAAAQDAQALRVWRRSATAGQRVPMTGEMTLTVRRVGHTHTSRARCVRAADGRWRLDYLEPANARGRVVWCDGRDTWQLEPRRGLLIRTSASGRAVSPFDPDLVEHNYRIALTSDHAAAAGRPAYLLELRPVASGKGWQRRWIDRATSRTLREEAYYPDGTLAHLVSYEHVALPARVQDAALKPARPAGVRLVRTVSPARPMVAARARSLAQQLSLRTSGSHGFRLSRAMAGRVGGHDASHLLYSDGLETVSVFAQDSRTLSASTAPPGWRRVSRGSFSAFEREGDHAVALYWTRRGRRYTAVSHIAGSTLLDFAAGLCL